MQLQLGDADKQSISPDCPCVQGKMIFLEKGLMREPTTALGLKIFKNMIEAFIFDGKKGEIKFRTTSVYLHRESGIDKVLIESYS